MYSLRNYTYRISMSFPNPQSPQFDEYTKNKLIDILTAFPKVCHNIRVMSDNMETIRVKLTQLTEDMSTFASIPDTVKVEVASYIEPISERIDILNDLVATLQSEYTPYREGSEQPTQPLFDGVHSEPSFESVKLNESETISIDLRNIEEVQEISFNETEEEHKPKTQPIKKMKTDGKVHKSSIVIGSESYEEIELPCDVENTTPSIELETLKDNMRKLQT